MWKFVVVFFTKMLNNNHTGNIFFQDFALLPRNSGHPVFMFILSVFNMVQHTSEGVKRLLLEIHDFQYAIGFNSNMESVYHQLLFQIQPYPFCVTSVNETKKNILIRLVLYTMYRNFTSHVKSNDWLFRFFVVCRHCIPDLKMVKTYRVTGGYTGWRVVIPGDRWLYRVTGCYTGWQVVHKKVLLFQLHTYKTVDNQTHNKLLQASQDPREAN